VFPHSLSSGNMGARWYSGLFPAMNPWYAPCFKSPLLWRGMGWVIQINWNILLIILLLKK
jgi:hypothetical protein